MRSNQGVSGRLLLIIAASVLILSSLLWLAARQRSLPTVTAGASAESQPPTLASESSATQSGPPAPDVATISGELPPLIPISLVPHLIDAENGSWLRDEQYKLVPRGTQDFGGIEFHLEGMIQLQGRASKEWKRRSYREQVHIPLALTNRTDTGTEILQRGSNIGCIYLLGGTCYESEIDTVAAMLVWRYTDGTSATTPIRYNFHVRDWIRYPFEQPAQLPYPFTKVVWTTPIPKQEERALRLYRFGLANPAPQKVIQQLDFVGMTGEGTLFVTGLTLDPLPPGRRPDNSRDLEPADSLTGYLLQLRVVSVDGNAVPEAKVTIRAHKKSDSPGWNITHSTKTDAQGALTLRYSLDGLETYEIAVAHEAYAARKIVWNITAGDVVPQAYTLKLSPGVTIGGTVVDESDHPIADVKFNLYRFWNGRDEMNPRGEQADAPNRVFTSDADGRWQVAGLPADLLDRISIHAKHPDFIENSFTVGGKPDDEARLRAGTHKLVLRRGLVVRGKVTDVYDNPIAEAKVWAGRVNYGRSQEAKTDAQGTFRFNNVTEGETPFSVLAKGWKPEVKTVAIKQGMEEIVFKLGPGQVIRGLVQNELGEPVPGVRIALESSSGGVANDFQFETTSGSDGHFEWNGAPDEPRNFCFLKSGYEAKRGQTMKTGLENIVTLRNARKIQGWVLDADTEKPITKFRVGAGDTYGDDPSSSFYANDFGMKEFSDVNGTFTVELSEENSNAIRARADDYADRTEKLPEAVNGIVTITLRLKPSPAVRGALVTGEGVPVPGASVGLTSDSESRGGTHLRLSNGRLESWTSDGKLVKTDASGQFTLPSPPETGGLVVAAAENGFASATVAEVRANGRLVLQLYGRIEGTFKIAGQPVAGQELTFQQKQSGVYYEFGAYKATTDEQGRFLIEKIPPGEGQIVRLVKTTPNSWMHSHATDIVVRSGQTTQVALGDAGAVLQGHVSFETPPAETANLSISGSLATQMPRPPNFASAEEAKALFDMPEWKEQMKQIKHFSVAVGTDGSLKLDSIPSGTYTLYVSAIKPGVEPWNPTTVASGHTTVTIPENPSPYLPISLGEIILRPTSPANAPPKR